MRLVIGILLAVGLLGLGANTVAIAQVAPATVAPDDEPLPDEPQFGQTGPDDSPPTTLPALLNPVPAGGPEELDAPDTTIASIDEGASGLSASTKLALAVGGLLLAALVVGVLTVVYFLKTRPESQALDPPRPTPRPKSASVNPEKAVGEPEPETSTAVAATAGAASTTWLDGAWERRSEQTELSENAATGTDEAPVEQGSADKVDGRSALYKLLSDADQPESDG